MGMIDTTRPIPQKYRILVCGDRNWKDRGFIMAAITMLKVRGRLECVIQGGCRGADTFASQAALACGITDHCYPAKWMERGRAAGPIRNKQMLDEGKPDVVLAFHDDIENSVGTKDMKQQAEAAGLKVFVMGHKNSIMPKELT